MQNPTRSMLAMLGIVLLSVTQTQARPIVINEVVQALTSSHRPPELRLESFSQHSNNLLDTRVSGSTRTSEAAVNDGLKTLDRVSVFTGVEFFAYQQQPAVEKVDQGQVQGTICDCGDIELLAGGFPKWPLLLLGGIPFLFIGGDDDVPPVVFPTPTPPPGPTPPPITPSIPEPTSITLLVSGLSGLGIMLRRRYRYAKKRGKLD